MLEQQETITSERTLAMLRTAMGVHITEALDDPKVIEIMVNPDGHLLSLIHISEPTRPY